MISFDQIFLDQFIVISSDQILFELCDFIRSFFLEIIFL